MIPFSNIRYNVANDHEYIDIGYARSTAEGKACGFQIEMK